MFSSERLYQLRRAAGLSLRQLAERSGLKVASIGHLETGYNSDPRASTLMALCRALGCDPSDLYLYEDSKK